MVGHLLGVDRISGVQINGRYTCLASEDGIVFGLVHPGMSLDIMYQLRRVWFGGHMYFDTFTQQTQHVREAEVNILRATDFWRAAGTLDKARITEATAKHDTMWAIKIAD